MRVYVIIISTVYFLLSTCSLAVASESALSTSPAILESVTKSGEDTKVELNLQNNTDFPLPIKGSVNAFLSKESVSDEVAHTSFDASDWFVLDPADFILQPSEVKKIQATIRVPLDAEPGGHYATIYFQPLIPKEAVSSPTTISLARVGILAFLIVPGDIQESIVSGPLNTKSWQSFGPITFINRLQNDGSIHLLPRSTLTIKNIFGQTVASISPETPIIILPKTIKEQKLIWTSKYGLGKYTASIATNYGTGHPVLQSSPITFYLFPWPLILLAIGGLTLFYKIFIVNGKRLSLALSVLRGTYDPEKIQTPKKTPRQHSDRQSRIHQSQSPPRRRPRRQSDGK